MHPIERESFAILHQRVDLSGRPDGAREVVGRIIHATADESFAISVLVGDQAVHQTIEALRRRAPIVCDARMVVAGIPAAGRLTGVHCYLDRVADAGRFPTRSAAAVAAAAADHPDGAVWVIGNAPTALAQLLSLAEAGAVRPAAVVGLPVGYVGAAEAKAALWRSRWRDVAITNTGVRGGSPAAAAAVNAVIRLLADYGAEPK